MRIVGGKYRSRVLVGFEKIGVRPTSDMARESLFNILQNVIGGARFLDLFSGSGAMGIEALSRGASRVVFNDYSRESVALIKQNLKKLGVSEDYSVVNFDALSYLKRTSEQFDIIYIDPPYKSELGELAVLESGRVLSDNGVVILESETPFTGEIKGFKVTDQRKYGRARLTFFKKEEKQ